MPYINLSPLFLTLPLCCNVIGAGDTGKSKSPSAWDWENVAQFLPYSVTLASAKETDLCPLQSNKKQWQQHINGDTTNDKFNKKQKNNNIAQQFKLKQAGDNTEAAMSSREQQQQLKQQQQNNNNQTQSFSFTLRL